MNERILTDFQRRALTALLDAFPECVLHHKLYPILFPNGRFNKDRDWGSSKGGPSRVQCAVNWHLGKLGNLAKRRDHADGFGWAITGEGRKALLMDRRKRDEGRVR